MIKAFFRQKKEEEEYSGFENRLERMEKEEAARLKTCSGKEITRRKMLFLSFYKILLSHFFNFIGNFQDEFERRRKARELANGGAARKVRRVTHHCCKFLFDKSQFEQKYLILYIRNLIPISNSRTLVK